MYELEVVKPEHECQEAEVNENEFSEKGMQIKNVRESVHLYDKNSHSD